MAIAVGLGIPGIDALLVASQVILSIVLPFIISPLLYCTSKKEIMSVRKTARTEMIVDDDDDDTTTTPEVMLNANDVSPSSPPPEELVQSGNRDSSIAERGEVNEDDEMEMVDYSNNKFVIAVGFISWLIIVAANVYVIVELGLGGPT